MLMAFECNSQMHTMPKTENRLNNTATGHTQYGYGHGCTTTDMIRYKSSNARQSIYFIEYCTFDAAYWSNPKRKRGIGEKGMILVSVSLQPLHSVLVRIYYYHQCGKTIPTKDPCKMVYTDGVPNENDMINIYIFYFHNWFDSECQERETERNVKRGCVRETAKWMIVVRLDE